MSLMVRSDQEMKLDFTRTGWGRVFLVTIVGTLGCVLAAVVVDYPNFSSLSEQAFRRAITVDILLPTFLALPLLLFLTSKLRELAIVNERLAAIASTDSLTRVLSRGTFTVLVDAYLAKFRHDAVRMKGALLVVDADEFKSINDRFGHSSGDEALRLIASAIRAGLRDEDLVGRIGGDEFSIFLPGSDPSQAIAIAERIRNAIHNTETRHFGSSHRLSISIGGTTFDRATSFDALFVAADERLYLAKSRGRNRVEIEPLFYAVASGAVPA